MNSISPETKLLPLSSGVERSKLPSRLRPHTRPRKPQKRRQGRHDKTILRHVHSYRVLSQQQIEHLIQRSSSTSQQILRRLYDSHWLNRILLPNRLTGGGPAFYVVDRVGAAHLRQMGLEVGSIPLKKVSPMFLEHTLAINNFRIALTRSCQQQGWEVERWLTEAELKADYDRVRLAGRGRAVALVPDGYFTVVVPGRGQTHFFLELDRGTMTVGRFREKVQAYVAYYKSGAYNKRYDARGFRVLTVVADAGQRRVENLVGAASGVGGIGRRFWFVQSESVTVQTALSERIWRIAGQEGCEALFTAEQ